MHAPIYDVLSASEKSSAPEIERFKRECQLNRQICPRNRVVPVVNGFHKARTARHVKRWGAFPFPIFDSVLAKNMIPDERFQEI